MAECVDVRPEVRNSWITPPKKTNFKCVWVKCDRQIRYVPGSFMDMVGLASRLPDLHEGVNNDTHTNVTDTRTRKPAKPSITAAVVTAQNRCRVSQFSTASTHKAKTRSQTFFPIKKPHLPDYRLVHDLRARQLHCRCWDSCTARTPYSVNDLCSAFFSVPLHSDSQHLFAFTYGQRYTYTRVAQGYAENPSIFNRVLAQDLQHLDVPSTVIQYVDDLLICSPTKDQFKKDSNAVLKILAQGGQKVSRDKLQFCQTEVEYLGRKLCGDKRLIAPSQIESIAKTPRPQTVGQMLSFLGMAGYSRPWMKRVCPLVIKAWQQQPLISRKPPHWLWDTQ